MPAITPARPRTQPVPTIKQPHFLFRVSKIPPIVIDFPPSFTNSTLTHSFFLAIIPRYFEEHNALASANLKEIFSIKIDRFYAQIISVSMCWLPTKPLRTWLIASFLSTPLKPKRILYSCSATDAVQFRRGIAYMGRTDNRAVHDNDRWFAHDIALDVPRPGTLLSDGHLDASCQPARLFALHRRRSRWSRRWLHLHGRERRRAVQSISLVIRQRFVYFRTEIKEGSANLKKKNPLNQTKQIKTLPCQVSLLAHSVVYFIEVSLNISRTLLTGIELHTDGLLSPDPHWYYFNDLNKAQIPWHSIRVTRRSFGDETPVM